MHIAHTWGDSGGGVKLLSREGLPCKGKLYSTYIHMHTHIHIQFCPIIINCIKCSLPGKNYHRKAVSSQKGLFGGCEGLSDVTVFGVLRKKENPHIRHISDSEVREVCVNVSALGQRDHPS